MDEIMAHRPYANNVDASLDAADCTACETYMSFKAIAWLETLDVMYIWFACLLHYKCPAMAMLHHQLLPLAALNQEQGEKGQHQQHLIKKGMKTFSCGWSPCGRHMDLLMDWFQQQQQNMLASMTSALTAIFTVPNSAPYPAPSLPYPAPSLPHPAPASLPHPVYNSPSQPSTSVPRSSWDGFARYTVPDVD